MLKWELVLNYKKKNKQHFSSLFFLYKMTEFAINNDYKMQNV